MRQRLARPTLALPAAAYRDQIARIHPPSAWFDASLIPGAVDGQAVATWPDLSGNGHHISTVAASNPTYRSSVATLGGRPALQFATTNMQTDADVTFGNPNTYMIVVKLLTAAGAQHLFDGRQSTGRHSIYSDASGSRWSLYAGTERHGPAADTDPHIFTGAFSGTDILYEEGTAIVSADAGNPSYIGIRLGCYNPTQPTPGWVNGYIAEFLIWDTPIPDGETHYKIGRLLAQKYGIPWAPGA